MGHVIIPMAPLIPEITHVILMQMSACAVQTYPNALRTGSAHLKTPQVIQA